MNFLFRFFYMTAKLLKYNALTWHVSIVLNVSSRVNFNIQGALFILQPARIFIVFRVPYLKQKL